MRRGKAMLMAMMAAAAVHPFFNDDRGRVYEPVKKPIPKGHKEFNIDGQIVHALNYKNALKKVKKIILIV